MATDTFGPVPMYRKTTLKHGNTVKGQIQQKYDNGRKFSGEVKNMKVNTKEGGLTDEQRRRYIREAVDELPPDVLRLILRIILASESGLE